MSLIDFPTSPSVGQSYSFGTKTWTWNGIGWVASGGGPTGPTGAAGNAGQAGATGPTGPVTYFTPGMTNGKIVESHSGNAVTFALKTLAGNDPSATDAVYFSFPDGTTITQTAALSITVSSSATMGVGNGIPFRIWIAIANSGSGAVMVVRNCTTVWTATNSHGSVQGFDPRGILTASSPPGSVNKTNYVASGSLSSAAYIVVAYADYESGLVTSGTWNASPTRITQWFPGMRLPGDVVAINNAFQIGQVSTSSVTYTTMWSASFTLTSPINLTRIVLASDGDNVGETTAGLAAIFRSATQVSPDSEFVYLDSVGKVVMSQGGQTVTDNAGTTSSTTYNFKAKLSGGGTSVAFPVNTATATLSEIMG